MCGIAGWIDWERNVLHEQAQLERMSTALKRRGPDAAGCWLSDRAAFVHRRLIVIDPEGGQQPLTCTTDGQTVVITYNGEIYNCADLRMKLKSCGRVFRSRSDTEVLLQSYLEWGEDCVKHLNGIFAFGIWDQRKQQLLLARDHLGIKPLFYTQRGSAFLFASEPKALLSHRLVKPEVDPACIAEALIPRFFRSGSTVFRNMHEVKPGHLVRFARGGIQSQKYWSLESQPHNDDLDTTIECVRSLLQDTVKRQLVADVPIVAMLSGGLDSSGIAALAARMFHAEGKPLCSYSIEHERAEQFFTPNGLHTSLDTPWAIRVAQHIGATHTRVVVTTADLLENIEISTEACDRPGLGQGGTTLYLLCKAMKRSAPVGLSGEGSDEIFGGYNWFGSSTLRQVLTFPWLGSIQCPWLSQEVRAAIDIDGYVSRLFREAIAEAPSLEGEEIREARPRKMFYLGLTRWLPYLLERKDRMSMAAGFEARVPFCDYRLVQYVWNVPWRFKRIDQTGKDILRRALKDLLPEDVLNRRKSRFPWTYDPAYRNGLREKALSILNDRTSPILPLVDLRTASKLTDEKHLERLIEFNAWLRNTRVSVKS